MTTSIINDIININVDGTEDCNLLCKLIVDYMPSNKCKIDNDTLTGGWW